VSITQRFTFTCHTAGCENVNVPITLVVVPMDCDTAMCGPCAQPITDVVTTGL
jgi:hypothetical protein